jgi:D-alanyl-D-alanine carboxypeptidase
VLLVIIIFLGTGVYVVKSQESNKLAVENISTTQDIQDLPATAPKEQPTEKVAEAPAPPPAPSNTPKQQVKTPASTWPVQLTSAQASSITVVINKKHKLPSSYAPGLTSVGGGSLRTEAANAFNTMVDAANSAGIQLSFGSGYRSYSTQEKIYNGYVSRDGKALADTYSARPGHSEHQTGLAVDVKSTSCYLEICFANTPAGKWVAANAHNYGFVIRYLSGKESITGYQYEPWHLRYLGTEVAKDVYSSGKTLEEYYNIPSGSY